MPAKTHGMAKTPTYSVWRSMKTRCLNERSTFYADYGGRGITVCDRWVNSFEAFLSDMGPKPQRMSIERKENNAGYSPENCVWATKKEQSRNRRGRRMLSINGEARSMAEWAEASGIALRTVWERCRLGWSDEDAVTTPVWGAGRGAGSKRHATATARGVVVYPEPKAERIDAETGEILEGAPA